MPLGHRPNVAPRSTGDTVTTMVALGVVEAEGMRVAAVEAVAELEIVVVTRKLRKN